MNISIFGNEVVKEIKERLGDGYSVEYKEVLKNNDIYYHAVAIRKCGESVAPTIYLEGFYDDYNKGLDMADVIDSIIEVYRNSMLKSPFDVNFFKNFSEVSKKLSFKLINYNKNKKRLEDVPYKRFEDLALVPICVVSNANIGEGNITITNKHLKLWEISPKELWENVMESTQTVNPVIVKNMAEFMSEKFSDEMSFPTLDRIFVVSNRKGIDGAAVMLYPEVMKDISKKTGDDLVIIPSSIHELIVLPSEMAVCNKAGLKEMVCDVNANVVGNEDILSNNVYYYDACLNRLFEYAE